MMLLLVTACHRSEPRARAVREERSANERDHDLAVIAARGWAKGELSISAQDSKPSTSTEVRDGRSSRSGTLGPFSLDMTLDAARRAARRGQVVSHGSFNAWHTHVTAWCAPPVGPRDEGIILTPTALQFNTCPRVGGACTTYSLSFEPAGSQLRLVSVHRSIGDKPEEKIGSDAVRSQYHVMGGRALTSCELTSVENGQVARWDRLEGSNLVDILGQPGLAIDRLSPVLHTSLGRWEKSVTVVSDPNECDGFALSPSLDGYWRLGPYYVMGYTLDINGEGAHTVPYVVVIDPAGKIVWTGAMSEFEKHQMAGKQQTPLQADHGG